MKLLNEKLGICIPEVMLPSKKVNLEKWAVVACDQFTSQPEYWDKVSEITRGYPSALNLIFPEIYLNERDKDERIKNINHAMNDYISRGYLLPQKPGFIYVDRKTPLAASRKGLIAALDLEKYNYNKGSQTLIRATEGTVLERLPPRIKIRENAYLELPHIMVLIDDPDRTVIEPIASECDKLELLYDFDLMMDGGRIKGYRVEDRSLLGNVSAALERLSDPDRFKSRYDVGDDKGVLLFAVGDGNHSLATAKACWEKLRMSLSEEECMNHPARYALVELINVHDDGLKFEPIHRVVFNINVKQLLNDMVDFYRKNGYSASYTLKNSKNSMGVGNSGIENNSTESMGVENISKENIGVESKNGMHTIPFISKCYLGEIIINNPCFNLEVGTLQYFLDTYLKNNSHACVDYIHGRAAVTELGTQEGNIGFYLPPMNKHDLFKTVIVDGVLPRKTFSMGEAMEKRYYLECRRIK